MQPPLARHLLKTALPTQTQPLLLSALLAAVPLHVKALAAAPLLVKALVAVPPLAAKPLAKALVAVPLQSAKLPKLNASKHANGRSQLRLRSAVLLYGQCLTKWLRVVTFGIPSH